MATFSDFDEYIHCQICFEVFDDPKSLECRHVICLKCVNQIKKSSMVQCPVCSVYSSAYNIKHDHRTVALVDSYQQRNSHENNAAKKIKLQEINCEICRDSEKEVSHKCESCQRMLCEGCLLSHMANAGEGKEVTHSVSPVKDIAQSLQSKLKTFTAITTEMQQRFISIQSEFKAQWDILHNKKCDIISKMDEHEFQLISKIKAHHMKLKDQVGKEYEQLRLEMTENYKQNEIVQRHIHWKEMEMKSLLTASDNVYLAYSAAEIEQDITVGFHNTPVPAPLSVDLYSLQLQKGKPYNIEDSIKVSFGPQSSEYKSIQNHIMKNYSSIAEYDYKYRTHTGSKLLKCIQMQEEHLYCMTNSSIEVYDFDLSLINSINLSLTSCNTLIINDNRFIISTDSGIYMCDNEGRDPQRIYRGSFIGLGIQNNMLYGCHKEARTIFSFQPAPSGWKKIGVIDLCHIFQSSDNAGTILSFYLTKKNIYISYEQNDKDYSSCWYICKLSLNGKMIKKYYYDTAKVPLNKPVICDVDDAGNMLLADGGNNRILLITDQGERHQIHLRGYSIYNTWYILLSSDKRTIWVADSCNNESYLNKFVATNLLYKSETIEII